MNRFALLFALLLAQACLLPRIAAARLNYSENINGLPVENAFETRLRAAELAGDAGLVAEICRQWYASGQYSPGVLNWNYNALMSVENGAVLLTHSNLDTYPALLLQNALAVRPDVTILSLELLADAAYRTRMARGLAALPADASLDVFLRTLLSAGNTAPTYLGVMLDKSLLQTDKKNLYLTGLALKFSLKGFDNVAVLRNNFENHFRTDYLKLELQPEPNPDVVAKINLNYIPAFALLYRHYETSGETLKADFVKSTALKIARIGGQETAANVLFGIERATEAVAVKSVLNIKTLEKSMKKVRPSLYAAETETTNGQYLLFLTDLLNNQEFDRLSQYRTTKTDWRALLPAAAQKLPDSAVFKFGHPDGEDFPVQHISREAAEAYCAWLTKVYNASPEKKKFKNVRFRLPTAEEWEAAARAGREQTPYPWGGYYVRNSKGCYLLNLQAVEPCKDCPEAGDAQDGGFFTVKAASYYPNDFGLYNTSGNVAEMIQTPNQAKGGSWADEAYFCQIPNVKEYTAPNPALGFRVFLEIIE